MKAICGCCVSMVFLGVAMFFFMWAVLPEPDNLRWSRCGYGVIALVGGLLLRLSGDKPCPNCLDIPLYGLMVVLGTFTVVVALAMFIDPKLCVVAVSVGLCTLAARVMRGRPITA